MSCIRLFKKNILMVILVTGLLSDVNAAIWYVATNGLADGPGTSWHNAFSTIQKGIDSASSNDLVLVSNGLYNVGSRVVYGSMKNRVAIDKNITVKSVNGPDVTIIEGQGPSGDGAVRCVYIGSGAVLSGFTLTNGHTRTSGDDGKERSGGGIWCENNGIISNCVINGNSAYSNGGGSYYGMLNNCTLNGNTANLYGGGSYNGTLNNCMLNGNTANLYGGGSDSSILNNCTLSGNSAIVFGGGGSRGGTLDNCTLIGNSAYNGGGAYYSTLNNCIIWYNTADSFPNYAGGTLSYCCTTPLASGTGNIDQDPELIGLNHISSNSYCIGMGSSSYANGVDIDGERWLDPPSIGCDEYNAGSVTGILNVAVSASYTNIAVDFSIDFTGNIDGRTSGSVWNFDDGIVASNIWYIYSHSWSFPGVYDVTFMAFNETYPEGVSATVTVTVVDYPKNYVNIDSTNPVSPYTSWTTAATNIQDAIDSAYPGLVILVSNGLYNTGSRVVFGSMKNRVAIDKNITVKSVNGPDVTIIEGQGPNSDSAVRCVYVGSGAVLSGFTLTNGHTQINSSSYREKSGGGVWCENSGIVSNCVINGNSAFYFGGGSSGGSLNNCTLSGNTAGWSGGGSCDSILNNCTLSGNFSDSSGGGSCNGTLNNCILNNNISGDFGGGSYNGTLNNCTLIGNFAVYGGGGTYGDTLKNCVIWYNTGSNSPNYAGGTLSYCCTTPLASGTGNIESSPQFVESNDYSLAESSPCIDAGNNGYVLITTDIDGIPRILDGDNDGVAIVDMGCYEYISSVSDTDGDGSSDSDEVVADTDLTNPESYLRVTAVSNIFPVTIYFNSSSARNYILLGCSNLVNGIWVPVSGGWPYVGIGGADSLQDTNMPPKGPYYKLKVELP